MNIQNFHYYLRCLVKITDDRPLCYDEIPQEFINFFTLPGISQAINICIKNKPEIDYDKVENYFKESKTFSNFDVLAAAIQNDFESDYEKLYACFYYVANHVKYDYERSLLEEREPLSIYTIFDTERGVCVEYANLFRELAKKCGILSNKLRVSLFENASKGGGWDPHCPPSEPIYKHEAIYIEIEDQFFLSEPTWAAGSLDENHQFNFKYKKANFLIPYYKGLVDHFPKEKLNESLDDNFTWDSFKSINRGNIDKELCLESNPFQKITVDDGFYEMQFSFVQPLESIFGEICLFEENSWNEQNRNLILYECLAKNLPDLDFSYSKSGRCRYKLTMRFPKKGEYRVRTFIDGPLLFTSYFDVKSSTDKLIEIRGYNKEMYGFIPITPREGLTKITNGFARIRIAVKLSRSDILIDLYEINKGTLDHKNESAYKDEKNNWYNYFATNLPFNYDQKDENLNDYLVEDWVLVKFPKDGLFEVEIYFTKGIGNKYSYGVSYYFDVTGTQKDNIIYPFFDLPNNRTSVPLIINRPEYLRVEPPEKTIILDNGEIYFSIFSEKEYKVAFEEFYSKTQIYPVLVSNEFTDNGTIREYRYSSPHLEGGYYELLIVENNNNNNDDNNDDNDDNNDDNDDNNDNKFFLKQNYFILPSKLSKESHNDKKMMKELKNFLEGKIDYLKDIPSDIREDVENMVAKSIKDSELNNGNDKLLVINNESSELESEEEKIKLKKKIFDLEQEKDQLKQIATELGKLKEEQEKYVSTLQQEKNEISNKLNQSMKQFENLNSKSTENDNEKSEILAKLKDLEQRKQELEAKANNLEQEKESLNIKFNEYAKQKEEQEKHTISLEQEKSELIRKVAELEKQKEEMIKSTAIEKSVADSRILSCENKIHELEEEVKKHESRALLLEQEKNEISNKLKDSNSNKNEMIAKLKELENQANILEIEKNSMNNQIIELLKQKKEQENYVRSLEIKNNEVSQKFEQLLKQKEEVNNKPSEQENDYKEIITKLRELEQRKQELEVQTNNLKQEKNNLSTKFNEFVKQKNEQDNKNAINFEQEKSKLIKKVVELEKQNEEIIKSTAKEKSIADSKVLSCENRINELIREKEEQDNRTKSLEQEKQNLSKQVTELEKQIEKIISRERAENLSKSIDDLKFKSNPKEQKPIQEEMKSSQNERKLKQEGTESSPKEQKPIQEEMKSNQKERKLTQEENKSNPKEQKPKQEEMESSQNGRKLKQEENKSNSKEQKPKQEEMESSQNGRKLKQEENKSNSKEQKPIKEEMKPSQNKRKLKQEGMESSQIEDDDSMKQINENMLKDQDENKHLSSKVLIDDNEIVGIGDHSTTKKQEIEEPKPKSERNSPRRKVKQLYDVSSIDQIILPRTPPKRVRCKRPIKLTVTLKDIGMENFDQPYSKLPILTDNKKITNVQDNRNDSRREEGEKELPKLSIHKHKAKISMQTQDQTTQTQQNEIKKSPRKKKGHSYNYDPSIFYTPICPESPVGPVRYFKDPVKLTVTLKDIGMEKFES